MSESSVIGLGQASDGLPDPVLYERRGAAAIVTINRAHRRNAVDGLTAAALGEAYQRFEADDEALCMILTGDGDQAFCAGADLKALETFAERLMLPEGPLGFTRLTASKPTIAAISGWCLAGGLELALWCDLRICAEGTTFGFPERRWGVPLIDGGTQRLAPIVGLGRALELVLTGRMVELDEAVQIGLVNEVTPPGGHLTRALELVETLAAFPRDTMLADRLATLSGVGLSLEAGLAIEQQTGPATAMTAFTGAGKFADGAGRGGVGV